MGVGNIKQMNDAELPDVSVVIPVYNAALYVRAALASVLRQSGVSVEVICVDDGSTDASAAVIAQLAAAQPNIHLFQQPNCGPGAARNLGIKQARGRYIVFLDADDIWRFDQLAEFCQFADNCQADILTFDLAAFTEGTQTSRKQKLLRTYRPRSAVLTPISGTQALARQMELGDFRSSPCLYLVDLAWLRKLNLQFATDFIHEDNAFTFALLLNATRVVSFATQFYGRRIHDDSIMTSRPKPESVLGFLAAYLDMTAAAARVASDIPYHWAINRYLTGYYRKINREWHQLDPVAQNEVTQIFANRPGGVELIAQLRQANQAKLLLISALSYARLLLFRKLVRPLQRKLCGRPDTQRETRRAARTNLATPSI